VRYRLSQSIMKQHIEMSRLFGVQKWGIILLEELLYLYLPPWL
jgi:hypothetical protein